MRVNICSRASLFIVLWFTAALSIAGKSAPDAPTGLMCNLLAHPELTIIDDAQPKFSWIVNDKRRGAKQSAYQIIVSSQSRLADEKHGDIWDSGKVLSEQSINVSCGNLTFPADKTFYWRVRTWDTEGQAGSFSEMQQVRIGKKAKETEIESPSDFANRYRIERSKVRPAKFVRGTNGFYFIDFGKAAFGTVELQISTDRSDDAVEVHLGEVLTADGKIDRNPGGSRRYRKMILPLRKGSHTYTVAIPSDTRNSSGAAIKVKEFMPDVMPFRYCELVNVPKSLKADDVRQVFAHYHFEDNAATFTSSSKVLNEVWDLCKYSIKATSFTGVYIDGDRERIPYEGDAYINQLSQYSLDREFSLARYSTDYLLAHPTWPAEWQMHMPLMAWTDYLYTGNTDLLAAHYDDLAAKTLIGLERADGLIVEDKAKMTPKFKQSLRINQDIRVVLDWPPTSKALPAGERDNYDMRPVSTAANAFHYKTLCLMEQIANVLGKKMEAEQWRQRAAKVQSSFNQVFFDPTTKRYVDGEGSKHSALHANMFALAFGLVPSEHVRDVLNFIESRGMACSVYGAQHLLDGLYQAGAGDYAFSLLTATNDRSWYHMKEAGSTITMEAWDNKYKENQDWNHAWGAAPANQIPRGLMGIQPIEPGFARVRIRPQLGSLDHAAIVDPTIRGDIKLDVSNDRKGWKANVTIPANTVAEFYVPSADSSRVIESKRPANQAPLVKFLRMEQGNTVFEIPGGTYAFEIR